MGWYCENGHADSPSTRLCRTCGLNVDFIFEKSDQEVADKFHKLMYSSVIEWPTWFGMEILKNPFFGRLCHEF